jgi:hypothetical protein
VRGAARDRFDSKRIDVVHDRDLPEENLADDMGGFGMVRENGRIARTAGREALCQRVGPQIGYLFPIGGMQGYLSLKAYWEFDAERRADGWNTWLTLAISPAAPPPKSMYTK